MGHISEDKILLPYQKIKQYKEDIIIKKKPEKLLSQKIIEQTIEPEKIDEKKQLSDNKKKYNFLKSLIFGIYKESSFDYFSIKNPLKDDLDDFSDGYHINNKINFIQYNLLYLDLILFSYLEFPKETDKLKAQLIKMFETKSKKLKKLDELKRMIKMEIITKKGTDNDKNEEDYFDEKIKFFNPEDSKDFFVINLNKYILKNIQYLSNFSEFQKQFENENNYSLYMNYKNNYLFQNGTLENIYKENINKMLKSEIIDKAFSEFSSYRGFKNPFKDYNSEKTIEQINNIKYYIYFPMKYISGITFKVFGIIFINKLFRNMETVDQENKLIKFSINLANKKVTESHETVGHYLQIMCKATKKDFGLITPDTTFINYDSDDEKYKEGYDGGDRLETLLFGNKIAYLTIKSSFFILKEENWEMMSIDEFRELFKDTNKFIDDSEINFCQESTIIKKFIDNQYFKLDTEKIYVKKARSYIVFRRTKDIGIINDFINSDTDEDEDNYQRISLTSNAFLPKKVNIYEIINKKLSQKESEKEYIEEMEEEENE